MIQSFANQATRDIFDGGTSKAARKVCPTALWPVARRKLDQLNQAHVVSDLRVPPANRLEKLRGNRLGQHSIRINNQYRVCFQWADRGPEAVEIVDYHD
ncbi:MAG: type II toxin-antitoxin system RelE/ParE family toxin [Gemmatimonadetes bacterium]|nr:type II toxin-antitoxin system RelE/ParE family toxin [Gemmatimonadota bacterium]